VRSQPLEWGMARGGGWTGTGGAGDDGRAPWPPSRSKPFLGGDGGGGKEEEGFNFLLS
jgi:hypothetical protein